MGAEFLRPENLFRRVEDFPILVPAVRRLHAAPARAVENVRVAGVERHREDVGAEIVQLLHVEPRHGGRVRQDRHRHVLDALGPFAQHHAGVVVRARMRDHADAHAVEAAAVAAGSDDVEHLVVGHRRPVDADEIAVGIVALGLAVARQPAIGAIGAAALRISEQQVEAARAGGAVHVARHHPECDRRRGRHLHVVGRAHIGGEEIVVRPVEAFRLDVLCLHARAVARVHRNGAGRARLHGLGVVEDALRAVEEVGHRLARGLQAAHGVLSSIFFCACGSLRQ